MSTRAVNADRKGPKDLMDLANKANAYKAVLDAKGAHDANPSETSQGKLDDAFEYFSGLHNNNPNDIQATIDMVRSHIAKGKAN
jgi:hypothetical protein